MINRGYNMILSFGTGNASLIIAAMTTKLNLHINGNSHNALNRLMVDDSKELFVHYHAESWIIGIDNKKIELKDNNVKLCHTDKEVV